MEKKVIVNCKVMHCIQSKLEDVIANMEEMQEALDYELRTSRAEKKRVDRILKRQLQSENGNCAAPHCQAKCAYKKEASQ